MDGQRFLLKIRLQNVLSYSMTGAELELEPLNVLIGPNAAGKSNLIEVIGLLAAAPQDFSKAIREGGGADDWLWKGRPGQGLTVPPALISIEIES